MEGVGCGLLLLEKKQLYDNKGGLSISRRRAKSAQTEAERDAFGIWHVCYSMHSSQDELEDFVSKLKPRQVISTTPHCRARELGYVMKSLIYTEKTVSKKFISRPIPMKTKPAEVKEDIKEEKAKDPVLHISAEPSIQHIPLFGMAVVGLLPSPPLSFTSEEGHSLSDTEDTAHSLISPVQGSGNLPNDYSSFPCPMEKQVSAHHNERESPLEGNSILSDMIPSDTGEAASSNLPVALISSNCIGLNETSRRMYRSLNMVVPRPLPSLLELDREIKRSRF